MHKLSHIAILVSASLCFVMLVMFSVPAQAECGDARIDCGDTGKQEYADKEVTYPPYHGPKKVVAVLPFENRVKNIYGSKQLGEGLAEIITTELFRSGHYLIVERQLSTLQSVVKEQELGMSGLVNQQTAPKTGQVAGAQYMIVGAITEFNDRAGGGGLSLGYRSGEIGGKSRKAHVGIDVRIIDTTTSQVHGAYHASATASSTSASIGAKFTHLGEAFKVGASTFASTPLGKATRQAVRDVIKYIVSESQNIPWQGSVIKADSRIYINRGESAGIKNGNRLSVFSKGEALIDPETGFNLGSDEMYLCDVTVIKLMPRFSIAGQSPGCQGQGVKRGDLVRFQ